jgi:DNA-binding NarL/FixJ family response regulator
MPRRPRPKSKPRRSIGNLSLSTPDQRRVLAEFVRSIAPATTAPPAGTASSKAAAEAPVASSSKLRAAQQIADGLAPRLRQTLDLLLAGDSEKRIALKLGLKPNSIHSYVKVLYRRFNVTSRGELLAKFVQR